MIYFLDLDGVLVQFAERAYALHGRPDLASQCPTSWDMPKTMGISNDEFWKKINKAGSRFWEKLPMYENSLRLLDAVKEVGGRGYNEWYICSAPSEDPGCVRGKAKWLQKVGVGPEHTIFCTAKYLLSGSLRTLLDDNDKNCELWQAHGGGAILWPQPWNKYGKRDLERQETIIRSLKFGV